MIRGTFCVLLVLVLAINLYSQEEEYTDSNEIKPEYGIFGSYGYNIHSTDLRKLTGIPSCCPQYKFGYDPGFSAGILFDYPIDKDLRLNLRAAYVVQNGFLRSREEAPVIIDGKAISGVFEHQLDARISSAGIEPMAGYRIWDNLFAHAGLRLAYIVSRHFDQVEKITEPADRGTFLDGNRTRNHYFGDIPDLNPLQAAITAGFSYDLPLNRLQYIFLSPELYYTFNFTSFVKNARWNVHTFRGGLALKMSAPPAAPPPPPEPEYPPYPELPVPPNPPVVAVSLALVQVDSNGKENSDFTIRTEEFVALNMRPLLNYVFFDENSSEIPSRYTKLNQAETRNFSINELQNKDALQTYYNVLNIIGKRLREKPGAAIAITGTNSNTGWETGNTALSMKRAESVRNYLRDAWGIPEKNMSLQARNLPTEASNSNEEAGQQENRRVEIFSNDPSITEPVITMDTTRNRQEYRLRFYPKVTAEAGIDSWAINVIQDNRDLAEFKGNGSEAPEKIDWPLADSSIHFDGGLISYSMYAKDSLGQTVATPVQRIPLDQMSIDKKRLERVADKEYEYYSLILFDYGKSKLGEAHKKVLDMIGSRIVPESKVVIAGYADSMGEEETNRKLAEKRAQEAAKRLKTKNIQINAIGENQLLYDNSLPEGRFYCRTVKLTIETPVKD